MSDPLAELVELLGSQRLEVGVSSAVAIQTSARSCHWLVTLCSVQVRKGAAVVVEGLTGSPEGLSQLNSVLDTLLPALLRRLSDDPAVSRAVLTGLVNLAQVQQEVLHQHW